MRVLGTDCAVVVLILSLSGPSSAAAVKTMSDLIIGHTAPKRTAVTEFLGIQYGQAPVGNLRFAAPQRSDLFGLAWRQIHSNAPVQIQYTIPK